MSEEKKVRRLVSHADCDHDDSKKARRECRVAARHINCDHGSSGPERAQCTRRKNQSK